MIEKVLIIIESQKDENNNFLNITVEGQKYKYDKFKDWSYYNWKR